MFYPDSVDTQLTIRKSHGLRSAVPLLCMLSPIACTGHEVKRYDSAAISATNPAQVAVLLSDPTGRSFTKIGAISVKKYKAGFSDPTITDADAELREAGAELGADAVIVRNVRNSETRMVYIDGEAIRYTDK